MFSSHKNKAFYNNVARFDNISKEAFDLREKASIDFDTNSFDYVMQENSEDIIERLVNLIWQECYIPEVLIR